MTFNTSAQLPANKKNTSPRILCGDAHLLLQRTLTARELAEQICSVFTFRCSQQRTRHRGEVVIYNITPWIFCLTVSVCKSQLRGGENKKRTPQVDLFLRGNVRFFFFYLVNQHRGDKLRRNLLLYAGGALASLLASASWESTAAAGGEARRSVSHTEDDTRTSSFIAQ